jgi:hypothetical protein
MDNGGFIGGGVDFNEYLRAIQAAPNGTWIDFTNPQPHLVQWMKCTDCGAQMDAALTPYHTHDEVQK